MNNGNPISAKALGAMSPKATVTIPLKEYVDLTERAMNADRVRQEKTRMFFLTLIAKAKEHKELRNSMFLDFLEKRWEHIYDDEPKIPFQESRPSCEEPTWKDIKPTSL